MISSWSSLLGTVDDLMLSALPMFSFESLFLSVSLEDESFLFSGSFETSVLSTVSNESCSLFSRLFEFASRVSILSLSSSLVVASSLFLMFSNQDSPGCYLTPVFPLQ